MKKIYIAVLACVAMNAYADDVAEGRAKADVACALCHGPTGMATLPNAPNLAGQQAIYMSEQLKNYRSGKRQHEVILFILCIKVKICIGVIFIASMSKTLGFQYRGAAGSKANAPPPEPLAIASQGHGVAVLQKATSLAVIEAYG